jgi:hypothetical protein
MQLVAVWQAEMVCLPSPVIGSVTEKGKARDAGPKPSAFCHLFQMRMLAERKMLYFT